MRIPDDLAYCNRTNLEAWCRQQSQYAYLGALPDDRDAMVALCRVLGKYMFYVDMRDVSVAPHLALNGYWETWITQFMARAVQRGQVAFDVGANWGYFTLLLSDLVGHEGTVVAFEPQSRVARLLDLTLQINDPANANVLLEHMALSDREAEMTLYLAPDHWGGTTLMEPDLKAVDPHLPAMMRAKERRQQSPTEQVKVQRLDSCSVLKKYSPVPDFIKIDAEGAEPAIFRGMSRWFQEGKRPQILLEWCPSRYEDPAGFLEEIQQVGYQLAVVDSESEVVPATKEGLLNLAEEQFEMVWMAQG